MSVKAASMTALAGLAALVGVVLPVVPAEAQWVFLARRALGRIEHMREGGQQPGQSQSDFATVILDAPAARVYETALAAARKNPRVAVIMQDPGQHRLQIAEGDRTATLTVVPFSDEVSQLMIAGHARPGESPTASLVVQAVLRICREMGKHCQLGG